MDRKSKTKYRVGDTVKSNFRARWIGVVIKVDGEITSIVPMIDRYGNPQRRRLVKQLHCDWLEPANLNSDDIKLNWIFSPDFAHQTANNDTER